MPSQMDVAPWCYKWDWIGWIAAGIGRKKDKLAEDNEGRGQRKAFA